MAPTLPSCLSPHVTTLLSPDLIHLLTAASLPPLHHIFQSYSPLPLVTTRTTTLTPIPHTSFHLRFSNLEQIQLACKEDEETRSSRFIDWLGTRIARRAGRWVEDATQRPLDAAVIRTPWWEDLRRCVEGEWTPSRWEGWNHPVAVIYAVSTSAPNPLQAISVLSSRPLDLPVWVESTVLRYILIVHTSNSPLNKDECTALYNAVKKQHGLHVHLLNLSLERGPTPIPIIPLPPQLPLAPSPNQTSAHTLYEVPDTSELWMSEADAQATGKFVREFLTQSLLPWMEKSVLEWNEAYSNNKRLGSRLFSSTRRMVFGSSTSTPATPTPGTPGTITPSHSGSGSGSGGFSPITPSNTPSSLAQPPPQGRRLAEFATFLGDYKVAVNVWETLRKEGKGGAAILPLLLAPSPSNTNYALQALAPVMTAGVGGVEPSATALLHSIVSAVRWEAGMAPRDLLAIGGERWLVWAASSDDRSFSSSSTLTKHLPSFADVGIQADEASTALLLGQAAYLSRLKGSRRRAALWYVLAAHRLEKCGIKSLTAYFLREAHAIYKLSPPKALSSSYADAERWPKRRRGERRQLEKGEKVSRETPTEEKDAPFPVVLTNIEHSLGRILYSSGDTESAVRLFLGLLQYSVQMDASDTDAVVIDDFHQALEHLESTHKAEDLPKDMVLPIQFCLASESKVRLGNHSESLHSDDPSVWEGLESRWAASREKGKGVLQRACAEVGQPFWLEVVVQNPIEAVVVLRDFALRFSHPINTNDEARGSLAVSEVLEEVHLLPKERRSVSVGITPLVAGSLYISEARYSFISKFPVTETLSIHGKRLNETASQRQDTVYSPSKPLTVSVKQGGSALDAELVDAYDDDDHEDRGFNDEEEILMLQGEVRRVLLRITNRGVEAVDQIWLTVDESVSVWVGDDAGSITKNGFLSPTTSDSPEEIPFVNEMQKAAPMKLSLEKIYGKSALVAGHSFDVPLYIHAEGDVSTHFKGLLTYCQKTGPVFFTQVVRAIEVVPILSISSTVLPRPSASQSYALRMEVENVTDELEVDLDHINALATDWRITSKVGSRLPPTLPPRQVSKVSLRVDQQTSDRFEEMKAIVAERISDFLLGRKPNGAGLPKAVLKSSLISEENQSALSQHLRHFILASRRRFAFQTLTTAFPTIPQNLLQSLFPLYSPYTLDLVLFWKLPSSERSGFITAFDIQLGVGHGLLNEVIERAVESKGKSIYAETKREHELLLQHFRECEWNRETDPLVVAIKSAKPSTDHDFAKGICLIPVEFKLHNYSSTNPIRYVLRLSPPRTSNRIHSSFPATYTGLLTHRGTILSSESCTIGATLRASSPGQYALIGWRLEIDVGERQASLSGSEWDTRARYLQEASWSEDTVLVRSISLSS